VLRNITLVLSSKNMLAVDMKKKALLKNVWNCIPGWLIKGHLKYQVENNKESRLPELLF